MPGRVRADRRGDPDGERLNVEFEEEAGGSSITHEISLVEEDDPQFGEISDVLDRCGTMEFEYGEVKGEIQADVNLIDGPGEDAAQIILMVDTSQGKFRTSTEAYAVVSARGGVRSLVSMLSSESPDRDLVRRLAEVADRKVERTLRE